MLTYAPCNYYNPSRNRRGGFHIRPCYFPVIVHLTAKSVGGGVPDAPCPFALQTLFPFLRKHSQRAFCRGRCSHRPAGEHCSPLQSPYIFQQPKRCMRQPGPCTFLFFRYSRQASTNARKILWLSAACQRCSGCHCTACTKRYSGRYTASISPSGATACARSAGASALMP